MSKKVEENKNIDKEKNKKSIKGMPKKKMSPAKIFLIVGICLITIPLLILGYLLISASLTEGPILADRFENDLNPAITSNDITEVQDTVSKLSNVESVEVNLQTATFKVNVDVKDSLSTEEIGDIAVVVYEEVIKLLPINTYFKATDTKKMYDLEINIYNSLEKKEDDDFIFYVLNQSSNMDVSNIQLVSDPLNPELAEALVKNVQDRLNPTSTPESNLNVGGPDVEETPIAEEGVE